ncbi:protein phosphatase 2C domain-containing protein [Nonomuraea bangladeshensis]|uniref:protein phosphatase 2C domain-containing protein n=1 Tax=Nonomuraea bangladeshensis TaxID=404385 RepID=UPI003C2B5353
MDKVITPRFPEPMIFGKTPRLQSAPGPLTTANRAGPDTEIDGADLEGLIIRGASVRGDFHRYDGMPRQDAMLIKRLGESHVLLAVADGLGSRDMSHFGAAAACRAAFDELPGSLLNGHETGSASAAAYFAAIAESLADEATEEGFAVEQVATTLTAAVMDLRPRRGARLCQIMRVGDSTAMQLQGGVWTSCFKEDNDQTLASSATYALPGDAARVEVNTWILNPGDMLLFCTDGLSKPMAGQAVREQLAAWWGGGEPPSLTEFLWQLSFRARTHDDDRTAICVWSV